VKTTGFLRIKTDHISIMNALDTGPVAVAICASSNAF
jgi:hypothetical protein